MKTEKKPSDPSCMPSQVVKEETEPQDRPNIKEESNAPASVDDQPPEDVNVDCLKDTAAQQQLDTPTSDSAIRSDSQNGNPAGVAAASQGILNSVKQESTDPITANVEELPPDCGTNIGIPGDGIQPLVSNVLAKQMGSAVNTAEAHYVQQQSQIFVFSTHMANKGAEMVIGGQYPTIIAYHMAQPNTKKFLEKLPNKMTHFRQNPHQWLSNLPVIKQKGHQHSPNMGFTGEQPLDLPPLDPNEPVFWNEQPNMRNLNGSNPLGNPESSMDETNVNVPCLVPNSPSNSANAQSIGGRAIGHSPNLMGGTTSPGPGGMQPSLQGMKVPDENLTPQQRQHREEQLATLTKMRAMLFPEQKEVTGVPMDPTQGNLPGSLCPAGNLPPASAPNQCGPLMDWQKMQHSFIDGKNKISVGSPGSVPGVRGPVPGSSGMVGSSPGPGSGGGPRGQGPPPPYHQTTRSASVPIVIQSPNPSSPNNPTSNLSLPSPRASSALNSPADCNRQFQLSGISGTGPGQRPPGAPGHLPGQSPTSQDSPNSGAVGGAGQRLNLSNPGTPVSHGHLAAQSPSGTPQKDPSGLDFPTGQPPTSVDGMFCRSLQSLQPQMQQLGPGGTPKELMPVPSPQQISYLNTIEGQELTIQKQANTSTKDSILSTNTQGNNNPEMANRTLQTGMESGAGSSNNQYVSRSEGASPSMDSASRGFGGPLHSPHTPHTPGNVAPHTPVDLGKQSGNKPVSAQSSPASHNVSLSDMGMGPPRTIPASPNTRSESSPTSKDLQQQQQQQQSQQSTHNIPGVVPHAPPSQNIMPSMVGAGTAAPFGCGRSHGINVSQPGEHIPLNPNNIVSRLCGLGPLSSNSFDPISSLAQMSQQLTNTVTGNDNSSMQGGNGPSIMPFGQPSGMHMMQMQQQVNEMNGGCHMSVPGPAGDSSDVAGLCMVLGRPGSSYSPTPNTGNSGCPGKLGPQTHPQLPQQQAPMMQHGIMSGNPNVSVSQSPGPGGYPSVPGQQQGPPPLHQQHVHGPSPYNGANVQVKPSAPNTIQYLPARPNVGHAPRGPPSLDFLRFANPLSGLEAKMNSPSINLQYFPNSCVPNNLGPHGTPMGGPGPVPGQGPGPGGLPSRIEHQPGMGGQLHPSMRPMPPGAGGSGPTGVTGRQPPNIMRMQHMVGGGVFPGTPMDGDKVFPGEMLPGGHQMPEQTGASSPSMYGSGPKQQPGTGMGQLGLPPPDTSQPLPPSMGGVGPTGFKGSSFMSADPSMSNPHYAQQYHHFQQQLYATGTRANAGSQGHPVMHAQPGAHQQFFMPK